MSSTESPGQTTLWGDDDDSNYRPNPTETAVINAIRELDAKKPLEGMQKAIAQVCRSLARNIDGGNLKGRAVANEATQLANLLTQLAGVEAESVDESSVPEMTRRLMDALATPPRLDTPTASYTP